MSGLATPRTPCTAPGTPVRRRLLNKNFSDPKEQDARTPVRRRALGKNLSDPKERDVKRQRVNADGAQAPSKALVKAASPAVVAVDVEFLSFLERHGVPETGRRRLLPLLQRWGVARAPQVLGLWTLLGDGATRPAASPALQAWGPAGTGKTEVVLGFLRELGIRHVRLNCACFSSLGELQARLAEELRHSAAAATEQAQSASGRELQQRMPSGRMLRAVDRFEAAIRRPLERLERLAAEADVCKERGSPGSCPPTSDKVVVVFDHSQELSRLGAGVVEILLSMPEVLRLGRQLTLLFVGRLPLSLAGAAPWRDPPQVAFPSYTLAEAEALLFRALCSTVLVGSPNDDAVILPSKEELRSLCSNGLMKFAAPFVGFNLHELLWIGKEVVCEPAALGASIATLQLRIEALVQQRLGLCDMSGLLQDKSSATVDAAVATVRATMEGLTKVEKRLLLSAYLAAHIDTEDDMQLFMPEGRRRQRRKGAIVKQGRSKDDAAPFLRPPQSAPLTRVLAIFHRLGQQSQLLGAPALEQVMALKEAGLLRFVGDRAVSADRDPKVICRADLPVVKACAAELNIDLAEYLCS